jgi:hypothetical protein
MVVSARVRLVTVLVGVLGLGGTFGVQECGAASIILNLNADGSLEVILESGARIRTSTAPGAVIPPGTYQAVVNTDVPEARDDYHMFHLTGPGVNLQTDLLAGDERAEPHLVTLEPSSTYVFQDERRPQAGRVVFTTSGPGTVVPQASGGSPSAPSAGGTTGGKTSSQGAVKNADVVGSAMTPFRGTLSGDVSTTGKLTLTFKGKSVSSLKSGRYKVVVLDETSKSSFTLQRLGRTAVKLTGLPFVGRKTVAVTLNPGQWMFYSSPAKKTYFIVTG